MGKKQAETQALITAEDIDAALALPSSHRSGAIVEGLDSGQSMIGRMAMYNGTTEEQVMYEGCDFKPGDFIDVLERRKLNSSRIVPLGAFVSYVYWPKDSRVPVYNHRDKRKVPPEHLTWSDNQPPLATQCLNALVAVEGEPWPYLFTFKRTGYKAGELVFQLEGRRGMAQKGRGLYELGAQRKQNAAKQTYHELTARPVGDCPASLVDLVLAYDRDKDSHTAKAQAMADDVASEPKDDDIPI